MQHDVAAGKKAMSYQVVDGDEIDTYDFRVLGSETVATKAGQVTPAQVRDVAVAAQQGEPGIMDRIGNFYAEHPDLVKTLGAGALMVALARFKNNNIGR